MIMIVMMIVMMMAYMLKRTDLLKKTELRFHATGKKSLTFAILLGFNHSSAQLMVAINLSIKPVKMHLSKYMGTVRLSSLNAARTTHTLYLMQQNRQHQLKRISNQNRRCRHQPGRVVPFQCPGRKRLFELK